MRRRDLVLLAAAAAVLAAGFVATRRDPPPRPDAARSPTPTVSPSPPVDRVPAPGQEARLPSLTTALPREIVIDPLAAVPLSADPVGRAVALFDTGFATGFENGQARNRSTVYVLGDDGRLRLLDTASLNSTMDGSGNVLSPFSTTALKPDGTRAAFPQVDSVVVVDLTTAAVRTIELAGRNQRLLWQGEHLLVVQPLRTVQLDPLSGRVTPYPYAGPGLVAGLPQGAPVVDLVRRDAGWLVRTWSDSSLVSAVPVATLPGNAEWRHPGWVYEWRAALDYRSSVSGPVSGSTRRVESVVVFDWHTGRVIRRLALRGDESAAGRSGCCAVLGWLKERSVLLDVFGEGRWILAWNPITGELHRVSRISFPGTRLTLSVVDGAYL